MPYYCRTIRWVPQTQLALIIWYSFVLAHHSVSHYGVQISSPPLMRITYEIQPHIQCFLEQVPRGLQASSGLL